VLDEIGAAGKPTLMAFNKVDKLESPAAADLFQADHPNAVPISAERGDGLPSLLGQLGALLRPIRAFVELRVPHDKTAVIARLHSQGQVVERSYRGGIARFKARIPPHLMPEFQPFIVANGNGHH
jgi:GTP-binding protein HflX